MNDEISRIIAVLKANPQREIYQTATRREVYWISYQGGGPHRRDVVMQMIQDGVLRRKYAKGESYTLAANGSSPFAAPK